MAETKTAQEVKEEGMRLFHEGLYDEAAAKFEQAREMFATEGDEIEEAETVNNLGVIYRKQDKWDEAIAALEKAKATFAKLGDRNREAQTLGNLGGLYADKNERDKAKECLRQAADAFAELGDKEHQGETLLALGVQLWKTGDRSGGLATYEAGLQVLPKPTVRQKTMRNLLRMRNRLLGQRSSN
ncbi:MAG: tetratricopeptide repeat protein [Anaerolineae bacterium]|nr:tetratricopeptide repeat protein [Anaerolineae bacterium]